MRRNISWNFGTSVIGGLAGTVLMDITAIAAEKLKITSGGRCGGPSLGLGHLGMPAH